MSRRIEGYRLYEAAQRKPEELARLLRASEPVDLAAEALGGARRVSCVGIGTSWNAACVAAGLLGRAGVDARAWSSADFVQYPPALTADDAVMVFAHTGTKQFSRAALDVAGAKRAPLVLVTSTESAIEAGALPLGATVLRTVAREQSAMFTVSHTAAMFLAVEKLLDGMRVRRPPRRLRDLDRRLVRGRLVWPCAECDHRALAVPRLRQRGDQIGRAHV